MYKLPAYHEPDEAVLFRFMKEYPFIFLSGADAAGQPVATQVPVFIDEREGKMYLSGHMMRNTDHHLAFEQNPQVLSVFTGPHCYVSATWYDNPQQASTWNYMSIHARGKIRFGGYDDLVTALRRLTLHYEKGNTSASTVYDNLPEAYREKLLKAIVAFEIEITSLNHVFKLSQDRDEKSYDNIIRKLKEQEGDAPQIAAIMEARKSKVFPV